jgi:hypothetical protein
MASSPRYSTYREAESKPPQESRAIRAPTPRLDANNIRYRQEDLLYPVLFGFSEPVSVSDLR